MALTKSQEQAVIRLFALAFKSSNNIKEQKKMYLQFENEFGKGINDWKEKCRNALQEQSSDEEIIEAYNALSIRNNKNNLEEKYLIRPLERKDLGQVKELMNASLNTLIYEDEQIEKFLKTKYSFVAYAGDEILDVL